MERQKECAVECALQYHNLWGGATRAFHGELIKARLSLRRYDYYYCNACVPIGASSISASLSTVILTRRRLAFRAVFPLCRSAGVSPSLLDAAAYTRKYANLFFQPDLLFFPTHTHTVGDNSRMP